MNADMLRADVALFRRGLSQSRERAQALIAAGLVMLNGQPLRKPSIKVQDSDELIVCGTDIPYVSRGGLKLEKALNVFGGSVLGAVAIDIGASTGGFTDVLLQNGAAKVYAIDVGFGQLDPKLAGDTRVVSMEHTNARELSVDMFPEPPSLAVMDVSFISIKLILPAAFRVLGKNGRMISLVKPQFEAGRANIGKGGIVSRRAAHAEVLSSIVEFVETLGWRVRALDYSPITGGDGNIEFLADMVPASAEIPIPEPANISRLVDQAHTAMKSIK